jgi:predicted dehydrogenase
LHFIDTVHYLAGTGCPRYAVAHFSQVAWKDGFTVPDSVEMIFEYPEGFTVRYGQFFGNSGGRYLNVYGTRGTLDCSDWSWDGEWRLDGRGAEGPDRIQESTRLPRAKSTPHMKNWLECLRNRQDPIASIEAGYAHAVAGIMAELSNKLGRRVSFDPQRREIPEG